MRALSGARRAVAAIVTAFLLSSLHVVMPPSAAASTCVDNYAPDILAVRATGPTSGGGNYQAVVEFVLTDTQIANLRCYASHLEIDFKLYGFNLDAGLVGWQGYQIKSNMPGAAMDSSFQDGDSRIASVTGIPTADLVSGQRYFALAEWTAPGSYEPRVEAVFVPSRWASFWRNPAEWELCQAFSLPAFCIFGFNVREKPLPYTMTHVGDLSFAPNGAVQDRGGYTPSWATGSASPFDPAPWQIAPPPEATQAAIAAMAAPAPVPWTFENLEGDVGAISPHNANVGRTPAAVEFNGQFYVFHYDATHGDLRYARTSPGWVFDILDGAGGPNGRTTSNVGQAPTAVVYNNQLHVFYYDAGDGNLRHATSSDGVYWNFENLDGDWGSVGHLDGNVGQTPAVTVFGGSLQLFYYDAGRGNLRHAWLSGGTWSFENLEGDVGSISHYDTNIGVDPTVTVHGSTLQVFYYDVAAGNLRHAWVDGAGWHFENLDGDLGSVGGLNADVGGNPTAVVYSGNLHVFYYDRTHGNLRHMWSDPWSGWHDEDLDGSPTSLTGYDGDVGSMSTAVVVGSTLQLFVYEAGRGNLRHLHDDGTGWRWENLDGQGGSPAGRLNANVGLDPVATTFGGGLQLFYFDHDNGNLRHAMPQ